MTFPNNMGTAVSDDSTTGQAPFGLQPNGRMLYTVAWHSGNRYTPGIATTIVKEQGYDVWITSPHADSTVVSGQVATFSVEESNGVPPFTFTWTSDRDGLLGTGSNLLYSGLSTGVHVITVTGIDAINQIDNDSVRLTVESSMLHIDLAVELWWSSVSGQMYQLQWTSELEPTNWHNLGPAVEGNGTTNSAFDSIRNLSKRLYRVVTP